jgi:AcrR family transcriptional regulator
VSGVPSARDAPTARGRERREHLIDVAVRAFSSDGFRGASIGAIAAEAGISEAGLLHHFPSKRDLLLGVLEHYGERFVENDRELTRAGTGFADVLMSVARFHEADPTFVRLFVVVAAEASNPAHPAHEWFRDRYEWIRSHFAERFASEQARGLLAADADPELMARTVIAILDGLELQFLLTDGQLRIVEPLAAFLDPLTGSA